MSMRRVLVRFIYCLVILLIVGVLAGIALMLESKTFVYNSSIQTPTEEVSDAFPVGVNLYTKTIVEKPEAEHFFTKTLATTEPDQKNLFDVLASVFASKSWYQNLASPVSRIAVIWPGERYEQVVKHFGDVMRWDAEERKEFALLIQSSDPVLNEGKFAPGKYVTHRDATPAEVADLIYSQFSNTVLQRYTPEVHRQVPLEDALTIASLLEREASDYENMREISGVIWNRLFINMPLQLDATLQYARGSNPYVKSWWPVPRPSDKYIDSPYNTYQNDGLPPGPIANPSTAAVLAALNPRTTDCLFYFHDNDGGYHCSVDYQGHVQKLRAIFGQGR